MVEWKQELYEFCQLMIDINRYGLVRIYNAGSSEEIKLNEISLRVFADADLMDDDLMGCIRNLCVFEPADITPVQYRGQLLRYMTKGSHPCFCRVLNSNSITFTDEIVESLNSGGDALSRHGPAWLTNPRDQFISGHGMRSSVIMKERDTVLAIHSLYWPHEATEWISRKRSQESLSLNVVKGVLGYGCDFVAKALRCRPADNLNEWRFSFSKAELLLIKNWSAQQRIVYRTIKVIYKKFQHDRINRMKLQQTFFYSPPNADIGLSDHQNVSNLCSYYFKILLLWAVEIKSKRSWDNMLTSTRQILVDMLKCLKTKFLPHYFIPSYNLVVHLDSTSLSADISFVNEMCTKYYCSLITEILSFTLEEELLCKTKQLFIITSNQIQENLYIGSEMSVLSNKDNYYELFTNRSRSSHNLIQAQIDLLNDLLEIIESSFYLNSNGNSNSFSDGVGGVRVNLNWSLPKLGGLSARDAKRKFEMRNRPSLRLVNDRFRNGMLNSYSRLDSFNYSTSEFLQHCKTLILSENQIRLKYLFGKAEVYHGRFQKLKQNIVHMKLNHLEINVGDAEKYSKSGIGEKSNAAFSLLSNIRILLLIVVPIDINIKNTSECYAYHSGLSPTVSISWFIQKAYTANHYYTHLFDYINTLKICDEIIYNFKQSLNNNYSSEKYLQVLLSTHWIKIAV